MSSKSKSLQIIDEKKNIYINKNTEKTYIGWNEKLNPEKKRSENLDETKFMTFSFSVLFKSPIAYK